MSDGIRNARLAKKSTPTATTPTKDNSKQNNNSDNKLRVALEYMKASKEVLDKSRVFYEAALLFHDMKAWARAIDCYKKATTPNKVIVTSRYLAYTTAVS